MQEFLPVIRTARLFYGVSEEELTAMLACLGGRQEQYKKDAFLLRAGDTVESIGLVLDGSVLILQEDIWGNRNILSRAGRGQSFAAAFAMPMVCSSKEPLTSRAPLLPSMVGRIPITG